MAIVNRGFVGRRDRMADRLPPGQYSTLDFPVLSAEPTPVLPLDSWRLTIQSSDHRAHSLRWRDFLALPHRAITTDIHCVTRWSKFDTRWRGVAFDDLLAVLPWPPDAYVMAHCYGGYTTNVPLTDLTDGRGWLADTFDGEPLAPEHGGPVRLLVPHLYFWKSAKWVRRLRFMPHDAPGFWEERGYHIYGDPWREQRYS
ncbi:sulfite oxidase-like oxidoreductase [Gordonia sp. 852002-10350_SCH5691597]|uniref:sulfite oxidase-like oxidoreductase n=1 Tax=Gordonia sp. 852002-10350_SCH5691597 TaxID=1834085 RepID=UPI0007EB3869|nr:sulfite oxidase-like oxidoreductase [Gordonia sp. 852002-10350_SCH5691597]OBA66307.1 molybdopterin-binding protein [Gordonia sp. 852002-10350_SCH5691597]